MPQESTFRPVTDAVKQAVSDVGKHIQGLGNDITGKLRQTLDEDIEEIVSFGENIFGRIKQTVGPFLSSISQWFMQTKLLKSTAGFLKKLLSIEEWRKKRERMGLGLKAKSLFEKLLPLLATGLGMVFSGLGVMLGGLIGPLVAPLIEPFRVLAKTWRGIKKTKGWQRLAQFMRDPFGLGAFKMEGQGPIRRLLMWFKNLKIPKALIGTAEKGMKWIKKLFGWMGKAGSFISQTFGSGFLKGFFKSINKIFWPIQIIMSTIDFIRGFQESEGDIFDKVVSGISNVLKEFFGFPVKILGMLIDWVAEQFGFENLGAKDALMNAFNLLIDLPLDLITGIKDWFKEGIPSAWEKASKMVDISAIFASIFDFFGRIKDGIIAGIWSYIDEHPWLKKLISGVGGGTLLKSLEETATRVEQREMSEYEKQRLEQEKQKLELAKRQTSGSQQIIVNNQEGNATKGPPPAETSSSRWTNSEAATSQ